MDIYLVIFGSPRPTLGPFDPYLAYVGNFGLVHFRPTLGPFDPYLAYLSHFGLFHFRPFLSIVAFVHILGTLYPF